MDSRKMKHEKFIRNNKLILKTQQRFRGKGHNVFTEEINDCFKFNDDDKIMQSLI